MSLPLRRSLPSSLYTQSLLHFLVVAGIVFVAAGIGWLAHGFGLPSGHAEVLWFPPALLYFLLLGWPTTLTIASDGLSLRWLLWRRFIPFKDIAALEGYSGALWDRTNGVRLAMRSRRTIRLATGWRDGIWWIPRRNDIVQEIVDAKLAFDQGAQCVAPVLRQNRTLLDWVRHLRCLRSGANVDARTAPVAVNDLWQTLESPSTQPSLRAAAAVALSAAPYPDVRVRIRFAAESIAEPKLRAALETAADVSDEIALSEMLGELESEDVARRSAEG